jgi:plastocyanin domain-containing protein
MKHRSTVAYVKLHDWRCFAYLFIILIFLTIFSQAKAKAEQNPFVAPIGQDEIQRVEILAGEYYFTPNHIILKVNVPTELKIKKESSVIPHDFVIKAPEAGINIAENIGSEPKMIRFTPTETGKFPFYCSKKFLFFKTHRERGMEGVIEVIQ